MSKKDEKQKLIEKYRSSIGGSWSSKYRPKQLNEYIFSDKQMKDYFTKCITEDHNIPGHILLVGDTGVGKSSLIDVIKFELAQYYKNKGIIPIPTQEINDYKKETIDLMKKYLNMNLSGQKVLFIFNEFTKHNAVREQFTNDLKSLIDSPKFQQKITILAASNNVSGFEDAILNRFIRFNMDNKMTEYKKEQLLNRLKYILDNENVKYKEQDLITFLDKIGIFDVRLIIDTLMVASAKGIFNLDNVNYDQIYDMYKKHLYNKDVDKRIADGLYKLYVEFIDKLPEETIKLLYEYRLPKDNKYKKIYSKYITTLFNLVNENNINIVHILEMMLDHTKYNYPENIRQALLRKYTFIRAVSHIYPFVDMGIEIMSLPAIFIKLKIDPMYQEDYRDLFAILSTVK